MGEQGPGDDLDGCCGGQEIGHHHVHFSEDTDKMGNTAIVIKEKEKGCKYEAHVGFLQIRHWYHITLNVPVKDASEGYTIGEGHGVYCRAESIKALEDGSLEVLVNMLAHKEKLLKESVILLKPSGGHLKVTMFARVLGKQKGTPMLRNGIKSYKVERDEESEASDWQGFT
ncbi:UPF0687 protein C20orf27 homolog [Eriocheir sinensis]|uniref:UPF0687 protein C20orf27 homolog n=1 Tax=Eriocheir sinensis TaxID=95602 RepID=UPI0021C99169|nr:UPF0687 protein C20orf27 homolog [Eriocheir sinensis]XP_050715974.1 UPF0687 protein C20orf27 homolog [Eriocheir sinensis]XP_050715975.1 UPF0687 protein C20orf27 homolog [Eriocheir sinensis]XP_050715977.1 UPF0687 protein C20orf27 homolog [Eriocheir sinensis]XP_050715978.1 UPF0687 protein C20orf27 homolog [Eriocheir sinensis]XP_050715979.1 UPF0687 protein C20orf27 homolog [Eriocheir sinensis]